jgi:hypothetical protein
MHAICRLHREYWQILAAYVSHLHQVRHCPSVRGVLYACTGSQQHCSPLRIQRLPHHHGTPQQAVVQDSSVVPQLGRSPSDDHHMLRLEVPAGDTATHRHR